MTASLRRTVIVSVAAMGVAFLLLWAASTGPAVVRGGEQLETVTPQPTQDETDSPRSRGESDDEGSSSEGEAATGQSWAQDLVALALLVVALGLFALVVRQLLQRIGRALPEKQLVLELDPLPDAGTGREALVRDRERYAAALAGSDVRNSIVACWVLMEESAAEAGVARRPAETATELVVRFLHTLDLDPRPVAELARLFHEARFSSHPMGEESRDRARGALATIHRDLEHWVVQS